MNYVNRIRKKIGHDLLILIGSNVIILDDDNRILLQKRKSGSWGLLGGLLEVGETLEETAIREVYEEANLKISNLQLVHVFSGPKYYFELDNLDKVYVITSVYYTREFAGEMIADNDESLELKYFKIHELPNNLEEEYRDYIDYFINCTNM
ncbi:MAG: NUDIX hydrolase [Lachnospiraceae bacterium]